MQSPRIESIKMRRVIREKCKIQTCPRLRRLSLCGLSMFCKIHEAYIFLVKLKYSLKKLFRTLNAAFAILQKHSGEFCSSKDFCNFMNFVMIPFLQDDVQNVFEVLGRTLNSKNTTIIRIEDVKNTMKSRTCEEIIDVEIQIIIELVYKQIGQSSIETVLALLDDDRDGFISSQDFIQVFKIRDSQAGLFFNKVFNEEFVHISKFLSIFSENKKISLLDVDLEKEESFFPVKNENTEIKRKKFVYRNNLIDNLREKLKVSFQGIFEAFKYFANGQMEIGFFQMQKMLKELGLNSDEKTCQRVLFIISNSHIIKLKEFKEFWCDRRGVCNYENCVKHSVHDEEFCSLHIGLKKRKAMVLMEKVKSHTAIWKSPRKRLRFYNNLEAASSQNNLNFLKDQLNTLLPAFELKKSDLESLHSIVGKIN